MKNRSKTKILAVMCAAVCMMSLSLGAGAEKPNDEIAGIEYESVADLQNCLQKHSARRHTDLPYRPSMDRLYLPKVLEGKSDKIKDIVLTSTYVGVDFDYEGQQLEFRHYIDGEYAYQMAKDRQETKNNKIYEYYPISQKVNGHLVYSYYDGSSVYCWKEGEDVFLLRTFDEKNPKTRQNFALCQSDFISLKADGSKKETSNKEETEYIQPQECKVRVVDAKGNPVTNLCVENYKSGGANPAKDYSKERWFAYTDSNGVATLCRFSDASDFFYVDNFHSFGNGDKHDFRTCEKVDGVYQVVWTEETPLETAEKTNGSVRIRVVDQKGKPVPGLEINAARYSILEKWQEMGWNRYEVDELKGFTDKNGYFSSLDKVDGSSMKLCITQKTKDGKEINRYYKIAPQADKKNQYKIVW